MAADRARGTRLVIPRFLCATQGPNPARSLARDFKAYSSNCGLSRVISKRSYSSKPIDPKKKDERLGASLEGLQIKDKDKLVPRPNPCVRTYGRTRATTKFSWLDGFTNFYGCGAPLQKFLCKWMTNNSKQGVFGRLPSRIVVKTLRSCQAL